MERSSAVKVAVLYAELDLSEIVRGKLDFDVTGHYARPDIFQLIVNEEPALPVRFDKKGKRPS